MIAWRGVTAAAFTDSISWTAAWRMEPDVEDGFWVIEDRQSHDFWVSYWPAGADRSDISGPYETLDQAKTAYLMMQGAV